MKPEWVAYDGSYWSAKFYQADFAGTIAPGEKVTVLGRQGNPQLSGISREIGSKSSKAADLGNLGLAYYSLGDYAKAIDFQQQYLTIAREIGDKRGEGNALGSLGLVYKNLGDYGKAIDFQQQYLTIAREIGDKRGEGNALGNLGITYLKLERYSEALENLTIVLKMFCEMGNQAGEAESLKYLAETHQALAKSTLPATTPSKPTSWRKPSTFPSSPSVRLC